MIRAVVFDMDGVLFDTERLSAESWRETAEEMRLGDIQEALFGCIGRNRTDTLIFFEEHYGGEFPTAQFLEKAMCRFRNKIETEGLPVMKGAREILDFLKKNGIRTGLASSSRKDSVLSHLEKSELRHYFEAVIGGNMVLHSKPEPDIYLKACEALGVRPEEAAAVEDSPNGIRSAAAAGMKPVMVPDLIVPTPEIKRLLWRECGSLLDLRRLLEAWLKNTDRGEGNAADAGTEAAV